MFDYDKSIVTINESINGISYVQFNKLLEFQDKIKHCFTLKSNNVGFYWNKPEIREKSIEIISNEFNLNKNRIVQPLQTHTNSIYCFNKFNGPKVASNDSFSNEDLLVSYIDESDPDKDIFDNKDFQNIDGIISNVPGISSIVTGADCCIILIYDPVNNVYANIHSGWRGTVKKIVLKAIKNLSYEYGSKPSNLIVCISPCIRKECYEIKQDVVDIFIDEFSNYIKKNPIIQELGEVNGEKTFKLDIPYLIKLMLRSSGVLDQNIFDSKICAKCNNEYFHSRRAENDDNFNVNGSMMTII